MRAKRSIITVRITGYFMKKRIDFILDKEVEEAFSIVKNEVHESDNSIQDFYY